MFYTVVGAHVRSPSRNPSHSCQSPTSTPGLQPRKEQSWQKKNPPESNHTEINSRPRFRGASKLGEMADAARKRRCESLGPNLDVMKGTARIREGWNCLISRCAPVCTALSGGENGLRENAFGLGAQKRHCPGERKGVVAAVLKSVEQSHRLSRLLG